MRVFYEKNLNEFINLDAITSIGFKQTQLTKKKSRYSILAFINSTAYTLKDNFKNEEDAKHWLAKWFDNNIIVSLES